MKNILDLKHDEVKEFLLKEESYINVDLPPYLTFKKVLYESDKLLKAKKDINNLKKVVPREGKPSKNRKLEPKEFDGVNYKLFHNKNGKYDWRPFELIHPILYINLVNTISEESNWNTILGRFKYIDLISKIDCMSLPIVSDNKKSDKANQILDWWKNIEQKSIELALEFSHIYHTDILDCYGSIYTHSIPWALHSKNIAKQKMGNLIGDKIDTQIQAMSYGQTNGIPQGSVLMDFIAEIILKYADLLLTERLNDVPIDSKEYKILRYRDDYRIFVNNLSIAEEIVKNLTEVLIGLGLKLNSSKTASFNNVIANSIKSDKLNWLSIKNDNTSLQKRLLLIHKYSLEHKNNSILVEELQNIFNLIHKETTINYKKYFESLKYSSEKVHLRFIERMNHVKKFDYLLKNKKRRFQENENIVVLLSIVVDIAFLNPKAYAISSAIISQLIEYIEEDKRRDLIIKMVKKFSSIPNTGHMQIWLQRAIRQFQEDFTTSLYNFDEAICKLVDGEDIEIWNNVWLQDDVKKIFDNNPIIDKDIIDNLPFVIKWDEVAFFSNY